MDAAYKKRNVEDCERKIENCERRLKNAKTSGEDVKWLNSERDGFKATLKKLNKTDSD